MKLLPILKLLVLSLLVASLSQSLITAYALSMPSAITQQVDPPITNTYYPSGYNLLGSTAYVSGTLNNLQSDDGIYMVFRSYASATSAQTLYAHYQTTTIAGTTYYLLKRVSADTSGYALAATAKSSRVLLGKFVYSLQGASSIPASTWTFYYYAYSTGSLSHIDVDIIIRKSDNTVRTSWTHVANSPNLGSAYSTVSATYSWSAYTIVDQTDYLEIDYYHHNTGTTGGARTASLRIDDFTLPVSDQTRVTNIILPSEYTMEVEFTGSSDTQAWTQLVWTVDSSWTTGSVTVTLQLYNYVLGAYPTSGDGYISYTSSATANIDEKKTQNITTNPTNFRDASGNWKVKIKGVKTTDTAFNCNLDLVSFQVTYMALDTTPPVWSNAGTNSTLAGQPTRFYVKWTDDVSLSGFIFGTNNTGTWTNDTWTPMSGTINWSNVTKILNSAVSVVVRWRVWTNDTSNNWNSTGILSLTTTVGYALNLHIKDWDLVDSISGAQVYKNSEMKISDANGWANWTGVSGTVQIRVKWYGFWVNGTFTVAMGSDKTIDVRCRIFDIQVTCVEGVGNALLQYVNVTIYNATSVRANKIRTGITGSNGKVSLVNVPNSTLTFTCYDNASPRHVIANVTRTVTVEDQAETITCDQNYVSTTQTWGIVGSYNSALSLGGVLLGEVCFYCENCLKERVKKIRSKQNKMKGERREENT